MRKRTLEIHHFFTAREIMDFRVDLSRLQHIGDMKTPMLMDISSNSLEKRLTKRVKKTAINTKADIAIITLKRNYHRAFFDYMGYVYSLYRYKN